MGVSLADSSITSATPGVLVKGTVDPFLSPGGTLAVTEGTIAARAITDQIDASYIVGGETAYWSSLQLFDTGTMRFRLSDSLNDLGSAEGPQLTANALANLWIVLFYGSTSAAWDGGELDDSDSTEPYDFSAASVTAAGPTNNNTLRTAINNDSSVIAMLVDGSHPNIDIGALETADPPTAPTAPTVTSTGTESISVALSADPTSDSPITSRDIRWKVASADDSTFTEVLGVTSPVSVTGLTGSTEYAVQWRANSGAESGTGAWSPSGTATTDTADLMPTVDAIDDVTVEQGAALDETLPEATGGDLPITYSMTGLASWMSFDPATRRLTGTAPNAASTTTVTYVATDTDGDQATRDFDVIVPAKYNVGDTLRLDSLDDLSLIFSYDTGGTNDGRWQVDSGGSTGSSDTGPGTNSSGPYVFTEASGNPTLAEYRELSTATVIDSVMSAWTGEGRIMAFRTSIAGGGTFQVGGGLVVEGRASGSDSWAEVETIEGWDYNNGYVAGGTLTDSAGDTQNIAQDGGWVDYAVTIPDTYTQVRIRGEANSSGTRHKHDLALWNMQLRQGTVNRDVTASHTLQNVTAAAVAEQIAPAPTDVPAAHTLQNVTAAATVEQFTPTIDPTDVPAAHTLQNVTVSAAVEQATVADTDVTASHTLQNITTSAAVEQFTPAARDVPAAHTLQNVTVSAAVETVTTVSAPHAPSAPTVTGAGRFSLSVAWSAANTGDPADTFDLQYRIGTGPWSTPITDVTSPHVVTGLAHSTEYQVQVRGVNSGGNSPWSPSGLGSTNVPVQRPPEYGIEIDWSGDTLYAHAQSDVTGDILRAPIRTLRGRNYASVIYGRSIAGRMTWTLRNSERKYDRENTLSPLFGVAIPQRLVRLNMDTPNLGNSIIWQGFLDKPKERNVRSGRDTIEMYALDAISRLVAEERLSIPMHQNISCANAMQEIVDQIDLPAVLRGTLSGSTVMERWWVNSQNGHLAAQAVEETEGGFLHIDREGRLTLDNRHRRLIGTSATSQIMLTDDTLWVRDSEVPVRMANPEDPTQDIANRVDVPVRSYSVGAEQTLWRSAIIPVVPANSQIVIHVRYPYEGVSRSHVAVDTWIDPVAGTDYQGASSPTGIDNRNGDLTVTQTYTANRATLTISNTSASAVYLTVLQLRGQPLIEEQIVSVPREDATSIGLYGPRDYPVPQQFISDTNEALGYADNILHLLAHPAKKAKVSYQVHGNLTADLAISLDLSERVTLRTRDITQDMFVESIGHTIYPGRRHTVHMTLSPALFFDDVIILDTGPGLGTGILGR